MVILAFLSQLKWRKINLKTLIRLCWRTGCPVVEVGVDTTNVLSLGHHTLGLTENHSQKKYFPIAFLWLFTFYNVTKKIISGDALKTHVGLCDIMFIRKQTRRQFLFFTFLTVRPVESIRTLTDSSFITKASVSTPSWALSCTKEKQGIWVPLESWWVTANVIY